ncbi:hypothetical protein NGM37_02475, partial [Streptomyces sp. TRM76130]|nr:hypothetical protein [Streptomyces sp. TRM76130]
PRAGGGGHVVVHGSRVLVSSTGSHRFPTSVRPRRPDAPAEYPYETSETTPVDPGRPSGGERDQW